MRGPEKSVSVNTALFYSSLLKFIIKTLRYYLFQNFDAEVLTHPLLVFIINSMNQKVVAFD